MYNYTYIGNRYTYSDILTDILGISEKQIYLVGISVSFVCININT